MYWLGTRINYKSSFLTFRSFHNPSTFFRFSKKTKREGYDDFRFRPALENAMTNLCPFARFARNYTTILVVDVINVE
jgi:DNA-binding MurR/RpiR family transcriptional regulator